MVVSAVWERREVDGAGGLRSWAREVYGQPVSIGGPELLLDAEASSSSIEIVAGDIVALSPLQLFWRRFRRDRVAMVSAVVILVVVLLALLAPLVVHILGLPDPQQQNPNLLNAFGGATGPSGRDPLGVDSLGEDTLSRIIYGVRVSMLIGVTGTALASLVGTLVGLAAGFFGGWLDTLLMRIVDVFLAFPVIVLGLGIADACSIQGCLQIGGHSLITPGIVTVIFIITISSFTYIARIVRGQVLSLREKEFVEASRSLGASNWRILFKEILPNVTTPLIVYSSLLIPVNILLEASLAFLGVGVKPPTPDLGQMISAAGGDLLNGAPAWWNMVFPGVALLIIVLAFNLLGDGLLDALNPKGDR
jgi:peptide/nickel transport system permease protein